ncbi:ABC transporter permease [Cuneatibacter sp. NSJ-177]|uniref:ABC transporter permease n=1 Tax=Cuneatibacter sp. NSJ-177 TaxID=2931401 RepID=UPI001FD0B389|nr:ABC transporter permease [Cuneatibacter sp. NSJ-177]MCJ7837098.1 ABC transporter permease [Cuneatibacter sp. NSJ-177]
MLKYIIKRLLLGVLVLFGTSILIFAIARVVPGDVATIALGSRATDSAKEALREELYLNDALPVQYVKWLRDVLHGNFGNSFITKRPVSDDVRQFLPATAELALVSGIFMIIGTFGLGLLAGRYKNTWVDGVIRVLSYVGIALPAFVVGTFLLLLFGYALPILPVLGRLSTGVTAPPDITGLYIIDGIITGNFSVAWDAFLHLLLPAFALALGPLVQDARVLRSSLVDNSHKEYMLVSTGYGLPGSLLTRKYLLKPSATSAITVMGMDFASLLGQAFLVEKIFNWPGISRYGINAMLNKDLNAICAVVLIIGLLFFIVNLAVDLIISALDPRMRIGGSK